MHANANTEFYMPQGACKRNEAAHKPMLGSLVLQYQGSLPMSTVNLAQSNTLSAEELIKASYNLNLVAFLRDECCAGTLSYGNTGIARRYGKLDVHPIEVQFKPSLHSSSSTREADVQALSRPRGNQS